MFVTLYVELGGAALCHTLTGDDLERIPLHVPTRHYVKAWMRARGDATRTFDVSDVIEQYGKALARLHIE